MSSRFLTSQRGGLALIRATWLSWLAERGFFFVLAFLWMVPPLAAMFVWSAAAESSGTLGGMTPGAFAGYYLALILVNQLTYAQTNWTVGDVIRMGGLTPWLLRPIPPLYHMLSSELAGKVVFMIFVIPVSGLLWLVLSVSGLRPELHPSPGQVLLFFPALLLAWGLRFLWGLWLAELAFWATRSDALLVVQDALIFILAGMLAPLALLPEGLARLSLLLPFRYMLGFPVEILTGRLGLAEIGQGLLIQSLWLVVSALLAWRLWRAGVRRYTAVGS